jgi:hypothetical protein
MYQRHAARFVFLDEWLIWRRCTPLTNNESIATTSQSQEIDRFAEIPLAEMPQKKYHANAAQK